MTRLDDHGRLIRDDETGTAYNPAIYAYQPKCSHGWWVREALSDGYEHYVCALCGADLGLSSYTATNTTPRLPY